MKPDFVFIPFLQNAGKRRFGFFRLYGFRPFDFKTLLFPWPRKTNIRSRTS